MEEIMHPLRKILVGLDGSEMDSMLIEFSSFLAHTYSAENVHFVNVVKNTNLPSAVIKEFPTLLEDAIKERKKSMEKKVIEHFDMALPCKVKIAVEQGSMPSKHILRLAEKHNIDAIVVGRKESLKSSSVVTQRLARRAKCSLLIVPEKDYSSICNLTVACDFSADSLAAMEEAVSIAVKCKSEGKNAHINALHVYNVPSGYHYTGKTYEEFARIMEANAQKEFKKFIKKIDTKGVKINPVFALDRNYDLVTAIYDNAVTLSTDCIVIGGKGKTASTAFFPIGTNTEKLISRDANIPLLIVRPKHKNAGLMEMLQKL